jgi:large subunit ribosomal protein L2
MGKNLVQQARGKGGPTYRAPSFNYKGEAKTHFGDVSGTVMDLVRCRGHSAPLAQVKYQDNTTGFIIANEDMRVGDVIVNGNGAEIKPGHTLCVKDIPDGTALYNIEGQPGDGGKFVRTTGGFAKIVFRSPAGVTIMLPSKKTKLFHPNCRATIGIVAGGGRKEKPFLKAGTMHHYMRARNKKYPVMSGSAQNAVDHPYGNKRTSRKSKAKPAPHNAPPGRNVGMIRPRRTGRKKGKSVVIKAQV